jgi:hypothetical protein
MWGKPDVEAAPALAALPLEQRTLAALSVFNAEFENGGVHQFFYNSSGVIAPEVHAALLEIGLERQAAIFKKGLDMLPGTYIRDTEKRRDKFFSHNGWSPWDEKLQKLTDEFYALDGGPTVVQFGHRRWPRSLVGHDHLRPRKKAAALLISVASPSDRDRR